MGLSSQLAPSSLARPGVCTSSTRPASPYEGQVIYETDTDKTLVWNGSAWVFLSTSTAGDVGLVKVIPTSVSSAGGTAATLNSSTGVISLGAGNTSVTVGGCFSLYVNYRVVVNIAAQSADGYGRIQFNNQTGSFYYDLASEMSWTTATVTAVASAASTTGRFGRYSAGFDYLNSTFDVLLPNQSTRTWVQGQSTAPGYFWTFGVQEASTTIHTGFTLSPSTGVWTGGTIRVYGYSN